MTKCKLNGCNTFVPILDHLTPATDVVMYGDKTRIIQVTCAAVTRLTCAGYSLSC